MTDISAVCVYCGSSLGHDPCHREAAARLGRQLAEAGIGLVYGGGKIGLMGVLADAALAAGGHVTGVIPRGMESVELAHDGLSELVVVGSMHDRKREMFERADAFVALPGGLGTLDETFEIVTWRQLRLHGKPVIVVDEKGYWAPLTDLIEHVIAEGFARDSVRALFTVVSGIDDILPTLRRQPPTRRPDRPGRL